MGKNFIEKFKNDFKFLEAYGFVFSSDPCNPNRPCYKNNHGEIVLWIESSSGIGWVTEIYYQINGWKYTVDVKEEYKKVFSKNPLLKNKIAVFKDLFEFLVCSTGKFYNLQIDKNISSKLRDEEVTDLSIFKNNEGLFNQRNRAITNIAGIWIILMLFLIECFGFLCFYKWSTSYEIMNVVNIIILISVMISELLILIILRKSFHFISKLFLIVYAFIPITLYFFFDRRFDFKIELIIFALLLLNLVSHLFIYIIKKHNLK